MIQSFGNGVTTVSSMNELEKERLILVVEDNADHLSRIEAALQESPVRHRVVAIANGMDALRFLYRQGEFSDAPRPDLILLALNLPGKNGLEILAQIKTHSQLKRIPIVVLTVSASEADVLQSYSLQGNCFVIKSENLDQLFQVVKRIEQFWLEIVTLPLE